MKAEDFERLKAFCEKEVWVFIDGFDGYYSVNNNGDVRNNKRGSIMSKTLDKDGYTQISLKLNGKVFVKKGHRLVAQAFIPNPENKKQVNHINGIKNDNSVENLEWATQSENMLHSYRVLNRKDSLKRGVLSENNVKVSVSMKCFNIEFFNVKTCMEFFRISKPTMNSHLNSGKPYKGFEFKRIRE